MSKCEEVKKLQQKRQELLNLGLCCQIIGPTGPRGEGINIIDYYKSEDELIENHPLGKTGDAYLVNSNLYIWSEKDGIWKDTGSIKGDQGMPGEKGDKGDQGMPGPAGANGQDGECEIINIVDTNTLNPGEKAYVEDDFINLTHNLTINIPKGEKGDQGVQGEPGEMGPVPTGTTEGILFASYAEVNISGDVRIQDINIIPIDSEYFKQTSNTDIVVQPGMYEIAFSGAIEEVDATHGGIFYLKDSNNKVIMDLSFKLAGGSTPQMHFSQNVMHEFDTQTTLQVMAGILGEAASSQVKINDINLLIKKIHM